ncbi:MAG: YabP/YqfC family sporulation protein [Clostridia bacterium]|nr:YabP/YqfC family sporulation protein [Clostridia bacterium]
MEKLLKHTDLRVKERNQIILNGVCNVIGFDESYVTLDIGDGRVCIEGQGLKIESLSREGGEIEITGKVNGVFYTKEKKAKGGLARLLG